MDDMCLEGEVPAIKSVFWSHVARVRMRNTRMEMDLCWLESHIAYLIWKNFRCWSSKVSALISLKFEHDARRSDRRCIFIREWSISIAKCIVAWYYESLSLLSPSFCLNVDWTLMYHIFVRYLHLLFILVFGYLSTHCRAIIRVTLYLGNHDSHDGPN